MRAIFKSDIKHSDLNQDEKTIVDAIEFVIDVTRDHYDASSWWNDSDEWDENKYEYEYKPKKWKWKTKPRMDWVNRDMYRKFGKVLSREDVRELSHAVYELGAFGTEMWIRQLHRRPHGYGNAIEFVFSTDVNWFHS